MYLQQAFFVISLSCFSAARPLDKRQFGGLGGGIPGLGSSGGSSGGGLPGLSGLGSSGGGLSGLGGSGGSSGGSGGGLPGLGGSSGGLGGLGSLGGLGGGSTRNDLESGDGCKDIIIIFARGTSEPGNIGTSVGPQFIQAVESQAGQDKVAAQGVLHLTFLSSSYYRMC